MVNEIRYEALPENIAYGCPSVFLAGPTVRGNQTHLTSWRYDAINIFKDLGFDGNLIIPEFASNIESDEVRYDLPVWEFTALKKCDCILFWIPRTRELIGLTTNHEMGYWMARDRDKVIYGRPRDAYRMSYLDIMWVEDLKDRYNKNSGAPIYSTLGKAVLSAKSKAEFKFAERNKKLPF